ncbi:hypothetical protein CK203_044709 [Vitis vinifera]|uniref:Uncharacterized protein n=1 Tax=Vitis vinifera TaxID=29760 RepID=A0A438H9R9_VITVI|nr:hypothetical protein CK203_044709 [Vitis vinifera]
MGWNSLDTVIAAEDLALTLQSVGRLREAQELLQRCLDVRKSLLPEDHIQISANLLHMARVTLLSSGQLKKKDAYEAISELDKAKDLLGNSISLHGRSLICFTSFIGSAKGRKRLYHLEPKVKSSMQVYDTGSCKDQEVEIWALFGKCF